jgi:hypothetical protein
MRPKLRAHNLQVLIVGRTSQRIFCLHRLKKYLPILSTSFQNNMLCVNALSVNEIDVLLDKLSNQSFCEEYGASLNVDIFSCTASNIPLTYTQKVRVHIWCILSKSAPQK